MIFALNKKNILKTLSKILGYPGLEPGTNRLKAEYSTIELATLAFTRYFSNFISVVFDKKKTSTKDCTRSFEVLQ
jgi:hypothetical protein